jgi:hypothetical protein
MPTDHNRDIRDAAREILGPLGCVQKGRSRVWYDDQKWWVGRIEFQPSGFSKGSYLNVGAGFLWWEKDHVSFDDFAGDRPWHGAVPGESFADKARDLALRARVAVLELRTRHSRVAKSAAWLDAQERLSNWGHFHAAVAFGISGMLDAARAHFNEAIVPDNGIDWITALNRSCATLANLVADHDAFVSHVLESINRTRTRMGLSIIHPIDLIGSN